MKVITKNGEGYLYQRLDLILGGDKINENVISTKGNEVETEIEMNDNIPFMRIYRYSEQDNGVSAFVSIYYEGKEYQIDSVDYLDYKSYEEYLQFTRKIDTYVNSKNIQKEINDLVDLLKENGIITLESLDEMLNKKKELFEKEKSPSVNNQTER